MFELSEKIEGMLNHDSSGRGTLRMCHNGGKKEWLGQNTKGATGEHDR
jgi:hypothetical protein